MASMPPAWISAPPPLAAVPDDVPARAGGDEQAPAASDPGTLIRTCANCGAAMDERKCKLVCAGGYFLSCSDYY